MPHRVRLSTRAAPPRALVLLAPTASPPAPPAPAPPALLPLVLLRLPARRLPRRLWRLLPLPSPLRRLLLLRPAQLYPRPRLRWWLLRLRPRRHHHLLLGLLPRLLHPLRPSLARSEEAMLLATCKSLEVVGQGRYGNIGTVSFGEEEWIHCIYPMLGDIEQHLMTSWACLVCIGLRVSVTTSVQFHVPFVVRRADISYFISNTCNFLCLIFGHLPTWVNLTTFQRQRFGSRVLRTYVRSLTWLETRLSSVSVLRSVVTYPPAPLLTTASARFLILGQSRRS